MLIPGYLVVSKDPSSEVRLAGLNFDSISYTVILCELLNALVLQLLHL